MRSTSRVTWLGGGLRPAYFELCETLLVRGCFQLQIRHNNLSDHSTTRGYPEMATQAASEVDGGPQVFRHTPFDDAQTHVRLLRFVSKHEDDVRLEISTWTRPELPKDEGEDEHEWRLWHDRRRPYETLTFHAISYTWGDEKDQRQIKINGLAFTVRRNCFEAMAKVRLHYPDEYFWIDSICINQGDDVEKSAQVAMIYETFCGAERVLACLGDLCMVRDTTGMKNHYKSSDPEGPAIFAHDRDGPTLDSNTLADTPSHAAHTLSRNEKLHPICQPWVDSLTFSTAQSLRHGLWSFLVQEYWSRVWIMPEIAAAGDDLQLLVGTAKVNSLHIHLLMMLAGGRGGSDKHHINFNKLDVSRIWGEHKPPRLHDEYISDGCRVAMGTIARKQTESLSDSLLGSRGKRCSDPRDRIYALLPIMHSHVPFRPDYSKSCFKLAVEAFGYVRVHEAHEGEFFTIIALALEVDEDDLARALGLDGTLNDEIERFRKESRERRVKERREKE